ncbi:exonuclease subunit SbcD [Hymenobacter cheonanensis]|uniref:exonuclease subunit SbcD n=1 Tax=Hymenobacter sp. CA2-7 TaxID=3063993 RepID=UPI0027133467|nr:exonuclease subunit SbcD [Hymenobacter sp. CA2-7]MDO7887877.1 exonuclease subunit SbcD [Hymenobacter sp. CA2-7]
MRVLHTADWHLGQRFQNGHERLEEHRCFLQWLGHTIAERQVEVLVVAGDVFDTGAPSAAARQLYYDFLADLRRSNTCHDVVVVGGNHDSAATLNASAGLLKGLRVHVVGGVPAAVEEQCLALPHGAASPRLLVAAVPFLRDGDVRRLVVGETFQEREERLRAGIAAHYQQVADCLRGSFAAGIPVLATGHLFAAGCADNDQLTERPLSIGNLGQITADAFPDLFDYVALGHLHRPQVVGGQARVRYSGAPVPLSFSETAYPQQVLLLTFAAEPGCPAVEVLEVPCTRRLLRLRGSLPEVLAALAAYDNAGYQHEAWAEVLVRPGLPWAEVQEQVREAWLATQGKIRVVAGPRPWRDADAQEAAPQAEPATTPSLPHLDELTPQTVFDQLLDTPAYAGFEPAAREELRGTFAELLRLAS